MSSSTKEKAKLAASVSKMVSALKAKSGVTPDTVSLGAVPGGNRSTSTGSAFRTPSRDRYSSPGLNSNGFSDDDQPFDGKSFNRSRKGSADRTSQASLDLPDDNVFASGGFGEIPVDTAKRAKPTEKVVTKPQPRRDAPAASEKTPREGEKRDRSDSRSRGAPTANKERTPTSTPIQTSLKKSSSEGEVKRSSRDGGRSTPPTERSETPLTVKPEERRPQPRREKEYTADTTKAAEPPRAQQLKEGQDARRSAPRRNDSPTDGADKQRLDRSAGDRKNTTTPARRSASDAARRSSNDPPRSPVQERGSTPITTGLPSKPSSGGTPLTANLKPSGSNSLSVSSSSTAAPPPPPQPQSETTTGGRVGSPGVGIRRKSGNNTTSKLGVPTGVAKAIAVMSSNTTRAILGNASKSLGRDPSPDEVRHQQPSTTSAGAFSLNDFVKETSSQYDFTRAPSRMSVGSDGGVSTPVQMRGANLLDSISEQKFPAKPAPTATAGAIDMAWIDATATQTTVSGIQTQEKGVRHRIQHAALFRPRVWFLNNVLPSLRQHMLKEYASRKRRLFVECAEPNFREKLVVQYSDGLKNIKLQREENVDRMDLERATLLWRSQVKNAFDRLVQQLHVEQRRKVDDVKQAVEKDIAKGSHALAEKTSFSYLHLHQQFGEQMLKRTKELYVYYFGVIASMSLKEEKERGNVASEQRFGRLTIEMDRIRFFIQHLQSVEYDNIMKYFVGEKRILESELRFKPKPRNTAVPSLSASPVNTGSFSVKGATGMPAATRSSAPTPMSFVEEMKAGRATPFTNRESVNATPASFARESVNSTPANFRELRKETQSPFPLNVLETQQTYKRSQAQQQQEWQDRELQGTVGATSKASSLAKNPQDSFLSSNRQMESQGSAVPMRVDSATMLSGGPAQHQYPESYQQSNPMAQLRSFQQQQLSAAQQTALSQMPPPATGTTALERRTGPVAYERLGKALQWEEATNISSTPSTGHDYRRPLPAGRTPHGQMATEDRRKYDDDDGPLPPNPIRGGHLLPKIDPVARKAREVSEGVINGLLLVSNVMSDSSSNGPANVASIGGKLPPIQGPQSTQNVVASLGRMLLGSNALPAADNAAYVDSASIDDRRVASAELDTAVALLLLLHKSGGDSIANDELGVRRSLLFYEQEDKKDAVARSAANKANRFYSTRAEKVAVEEQEMRHELELLQRHEFGLQIQRQQWVEYFLLTTEESSERERIVGMSHLSKAIVTKNAKQEFSVTCLMQHQVLALQQFHLYQRWFLGDVELPTAVGLKVYQNERRERNKILMQMDKEGRLLSQDAKDRRTNKAIYKPTAVVNPLEFEALSSVEEVHRRNIARQFADSFERFVFEMWEEPMHRAVVAIARERWFRDLVRPSQHRISINVNEGKSRELVVKEEASARVTLSMKMIQMAYEAGFQDLVAAEQRDYRRLSLNYLKEKRQRETRERENLAKRETMQKYLQGQITSSPQHKHPGLGDALNKYVAATAAESRSGTSTPMPDYSVMLRAKNLGRQ